MRLRYDVVIVGAGPAGASAAQVTASAGLRTLVIDRKRLAGEPVQCAEWVPRSLLSHISRQSGFLQPTQKLITEAAGDIRSVMHMPGAMLDRARFDSKLCSYAQAQGAVFNWRTSLQAVNPGLRQITVTQGGRVEQINFRRMIAADGPRSRVAQELGMTALSVILSRQYRVALREPLPDIYTWLSPDYPGGYAWLFPRGDQANLGIAMACGVNPCTRSGKRICTERSLQQHLDALHRQLVDRGLVENEILSMTGGAIPVTGLRKQLVHGTVLFAGDAAGCVDPVTGAGIANAVYSGEMAGAACVDSLLRHDPDALPGYAEELRILLAHSQRHALERRRLLSRGHAADLCYAWVGFPQYHEALPRENIQ